MTRPLQLKMKSEEGMEIDLDILRKHLGKLIYVEIKDLGNFVGTLDMVGLQFMQFSNFAKTVNDDKNTIHYYNGVLDENGVASYMVTSSSTKSPRDAYCTRQIIARDGIERVVSVADIMADIRRLREGPLPQ